MSDSFNIEAILKKQRKFVKDRDWDKFHTPKNLVMALAGEVGELLEIFQWISEEESHRVTKNPEKFEEVSDELADILYYLLRISDKLSIDLEKAFWTKFKKTEKKYPVRLAKGNSRKYTEF